MATTTILASRPILIIVHGGAGIYATITHDNISRSTIEQGVITAAKAGFNILEAHGSALDAVQAAVVEMENNPIFNAGRGSCLTIDGQIEMDASIMDGSNLATGAVACIRNVKNPIEVARLVLEKSDHVLFTGDSALKFAESHRVKKVPDEYLMTDKSKRRLESFPTFSPSAKVEFYDKKPEDIAHHHSISHPPPPGFHPDGEDHDTVGAVAIDAQGNVAYATSTGGITAKLVGRVGDSPLVGCGGYADNHSCAVSTTGHGEAIIRVCLAKHIALLVEQGINIQSAVEAGLNLMLERVKGDGGCIAVDSSGNPGIFFTTQGMAWAYCTADRNVHYGIYKDEHFLQAL